MSLAKQSANEGSAKQVFAKQGFVHRPWAPLVLGVGIIVGGTILGIILGTVSDFGFTRMSLILITTVLLLGLGVVTGTAGMIALCQLSFAAAGAYIVEWMSLHHVASFLGGSAFIFYMICGAAFAMVMGIIVGLPALRLRGVNLAVVTLSLSFVFDVTIVTLGFPGTKTNEFIDRPFGIGGSPEDKDTMWVALFALIITAIVAVAVVYLQRSRLGSSWKMVAFSERGTASSGTNVRFAKLTAFAVSAGVGGIAGGLFEALYRQGNPTLFGPYSSLVLYVLSAIVGSYLIDMAFFGGVLSVVIPFILTRLSWPMFIGDMLFGVLGIQALTTGSNLGEIGRAHV